MVNRQKLAESFSIKLNSPFATHLSPLIRNLTFEITWLERQAVGAFLCNCEWSNKKLIKGKVVFKY